MPGSPNNVHAHLVVDGEDGADRRRAIRVRVLATVHFNSDAITNERVHFEVTGSTGVLTLENPDHFGGVVALQREGQATAIAVPSTFGLSTNLRGAGVAEMAWAIKAGRRPRASKELALHVRRCSAWTIQDAKGGRAP